MFEDEWCAASVRCECRFRHNGSVAAAPSSPLYLLLLLLLSTPSSCLNVALFPLPTFTQTEKLVPCSTSCKKSLRASRVLCTNQPTRNLSSGQHTKCYFAHDCVAMHSPDVDKAVISDYVWTEVVLFSQGPG